MGLDATHEPVSKKYCGAGVCVCPVYVQVCVRECLHLSVSVVLAHVHLCTCAHVCVCGSSEAHSGLSSHYFLFLQLRETFTPLEWGNPPPSICYIVLRDGLSASQALASL